MALNACDDDTFVVTMLREICYSIEAAQDIAEDIFLFAVPADAALTKAQLALPLRRLLYLMGEINDESLKGKLVEIDILVRQFLPGYVGYKLVILINI